MTQSINCYSCSKSIPLLTGTIHRSDDCPYCRVSLRCCKMCKFYDAHSYNECKEPVAERIVDKEKANFCDFFSPGNSAAAIDEKEKAKNAFESLFKK